MSHSFLPLSVQLAGQLHQTPGRLSLRLKLLLRLASPAELAGLYSEMLALPAPPFLDSQDLESFLVSVHTDALLLLARSLASTGLMGRLSGLLVEITSDQTLSLLRAAIEAALFHFQWQALGWVMGWATEQGRLPELEGFLREIWRGWYRAAGDNLERLRQLDLHWQHEPLYELMDFRPERADYMAYLLGLQQDPILYLEDKLYELVVLFDDALDFALGSSNPALLQRVELYLHYWALLMRHTQERLPYHLGRQKLLSMLADVRVDLINLLHFVLKEQPELESFVWTTAITGNRGLEEVPSQLLVRLLNWGLDADVLLLVSAQKGLLDKVQLALEAGADQIPQALEMAAPHPQVVAYLSHQ